MMSDKRRIAFLCHPYHRGGVTRWMADAAIGAAAMGLEVYFITVEPAKEFVSAGGRERMYDLLSNNTGITLISRKVNFTFEFGTEPYRANVYAALIREKVPEGTAVIVSDDSAVWAAAGSIADKYPMIGVLHGDQEVYYNLAKKYHQQMSICVCVSNRIKDTAIRKFYYLDPNRLYTIPCGINLPEFAPYTKTSEVIKLVFIGRLTDYEKRAADLIAIGTRMHEQGVAFSLDIAGNDEQSKKDFSQRFTEAGIAEAVSFHGWLPAGDVQKLLNTSDILLLTSNSEGMPLVMMEALASGCGFAGTRVSGIEDYEHNPAAAGCVSVYTVGNIAEAVTKIKQLAAVPARTRQTAARKLAETEFSMQVCLERYFKAIGTLKTRIATAQNIGMPSGGKIKSNTLALARYLKMSILPRKK